MLVLIITVCLSASPAECREVHLPQLAQNVTPLQCAMNGMTAAAKWASEHPAETVRKYRCVPAHKIGRTI